MLLVLMLRCLTDTIQFKRRPIEHQMGISAVFINFWQSTIRSLNRIKPTVGST